jgi:hypothetical protein
MNRSISWSFYHYFIFIVNCFQQFCVSLGVFQHILAFLIWERESICKEIFCIFMENNLKMELCVIFFRLSKNKIYKYHSLLDSFPIIVACLENRPKIFTKFHLTKSNSTWELNCCIFLTTNLIFVWRLTPQTEK